MHVLTIFEGAVEPGEQGEILGVIAKEDKCEYKALSTYVLSRCGFPIHSGV